MLAMQSMTHLPQSMRSKPFLALLMFTLRLLVPVLRKPWERPIAIVKRESATT